MQNSFLTTFIAANTSPEDLLNSIERQQPKIILCSIEDANNPAIQKQFQKLEVSYIAVDEAQVSCTLLNSFNTHFKRRFVPLNMVILPFLGVFQCLLTKIKNVASRWSTYE